MKKKMIIAVLTMSMVLGAGSASRLRSRQNRILHQYRRTGTDCDSRKVLRCADGAGLRDALQEKTGS